MHPLQHGRAGATLGRGYTDYSLLLLLLESCDEDLQGHRDVSLAHGIVVIDDEGLMCLGDLGLEGGLVREVTFLSGVLVRFGFVFLGSRTSTGISRPLLCVGTFLFLVFGTVTITRFPLLMWTEMNTICTFPELLPLIIPGSVSVELPAVLPVHHVGLDVLDEIVVHLVFINMVSQVGNFGSSVIAMTTLKTNCRIGIVGSSHVLEFLHGIFNQLEVLVFVLVIRVEIDVVLS